MKIFVAICGDVGDDWVHFCLRWVRL